MLPTTSSGTGAIVRTTDATLTDPTITGATISAPTLTGAIDASGATISSPSITGGTATNITLVTPAISGQPTMSIGSDADGDMYYRASSALARLAKGAADTKLFMNAGATAPEWAVGLKVIMAIRAMDSESGSVNYTGVGFKPSAVLILSSQLGTGIWSIGIQDIGDAWSLYGYSGNWYNYGNLVYLIEAVGKTQTGNITTWGADGFTITWTREGVPAAGGVRMLFLCFR